VVWASLVRFSRLGGTVARIFCTCSAKLSCPGTRGVEEGECAHARISITAPSRARKGCRTSNVKRRPCVSRNSEARTSSGEVLSIIDANLVMRK